MALKSERTELRSQGNALRRSGLPLEFGVEKVVESVGGMLYKGRYFYERDEKTCETDSWTIGGYTSGANEVEHAMFIECESRDNEKCWCFFPQANNVVDLSRNAFFPDLVNPKNSIGHTGIAAVGKITREFYGGFPVAGDGIELYQNNKGLWDCNKESIKDAIRQAILPIGDHLHWIFHRNFVLSYEGQKFMFYTPVIVTTARLLVLKQSVDWAKLKTFDKLEECFQPCPAVTCVFSTPTYVERFWRQRATMYLEEIRQGSPECLRNADFLKRYGPSDHDRVRGLANTVVERRPTRLLIMEFDDLENTLREYVGQVMKAFSEVLPK